MTIVNAPKVDPELARQLTAAELSGHDIACIVSVHHVPGPNGYAKWDSGVGDLLGRVGLATGEQAEDVNVMAMMATAYVSGSPAFLRSLIASPEILAAMPAIPARF
ncbi:MAG: hypothetical protein IPL43_06600 [Micropruina sp.]|nr:hypothetical protein [Micropruina sp.]